MKGKHFYQRRMGMNDELTCIIPFMILSIVSASLSGTVLLGVATGAAIFDSHRPLYVDCFYAYDYETPCPDRVDRIVINSVLALVAVGESVTAIISSAFCCRTICCGQRRDNILYHIPIEQHIPTANIEAQARASGSVAQQNSPPSYSNVTGTMTENVDACLIDNEVQA
ncbi:uncharacterized protein LOC144447160 [Glandiceps talaboti]